MPGSRALAALAAAVFCVWSGPVRAWDSAREVVHGSCRVLDKGEMIIGVLSPLAYGIHDRVTVFTHPALHLLLTPNIWARMALLDEDTGLSLEGGYKQSFFSISGSSEGYPGFFQLGAIVSTLLTENLQVSAAGGYVVDIDPETGGTYVPGFYYRAGSQWVFKRVNMVLLEGRGKVMKETGAETPNVSAIFARQLGRMRLGVGAVFGEFDLIPGDTPLQLYPWVDLWWRF